MTSTRTWPNYDPELLDFQARVLPNSPALSMRDTFGRPWFVVVGDSIAMNPTTWSIVVLDHATNCAGLLVETVTALHAEALGHRDLHTLYIVVVPERLEEGVREAEDQKILHRFAPWANE